MDQLVAANNTEAIQQLKEIFGLGSLTDIRDFAMTIAFPLGGPLNYPTNTWQELNWDPAQGSDDFWYFCKNVTNLDAPTNITAVDYVLANYTDGQRWTNLGNYANYVKQVVVPLCPSPDLIDTTECFSTQNASYWSDPTNSLDRSYMYQTCTELGVYQVAPPPGQPALISRVLQIDYTQQWCDWSFPAGKYNRIPPTPDLTYFDQYGNLNFQAPRLAFIDGNQDVWLDVTYHSNLAPERVQLESQGYLHPELLIATGGHHWDSYGRGWQGIPSEPQFIRAAHEWEIRTVRSWLEMWKNEKGGRHAEL